MAELAINNLRKVFGTEVAVEDFDLRIGHGEFVSFLGPSGCGKTTTLRMVAGFEHPSSGTITLDGADLTHKPANQRNVGMVFQSYALFPNMTVARNVGFGLALRGDKKPEIEQRVGDLLELIKLPDKGGSYPHQLSGGQQQRVALARALAPRPQVLLLDEPLSALDAKIRDELRSEIRRIQQDLGITTIYVTHDQEEAMALSDRVVVMSRGKIEQVGTPVEIYGFPRTEFVASFVGKLNRLLVTVVDQSTVAYHGAALRTTTAIEGGPGSAAELAVRPEQVQLGADGSNRLTGTIEVITFLGAVVRVRVRLEEGTITADMVSQRRHRLPAVGEPVTVSFDPEGCWVIQ